MTYRSYLNNKGKKILPTENEYMLYKRKWKEKERERKKNKQRKRQENAYIFVPNRLSIIYEHKPCQITHCSTPTLSHAVCHLLNWDFWTLLFFPTSVNKVLFFTFINSMSLHFSLSFQLTSDLKNCYKYCFLVFILFFFITICP